MKIYTQNIKINPENIFSNIINTKNLYKTTNIYNYIYSNNGIFILQNNQVNKLIPNDIPIEIYTFNNIEFIIDYSSYIFRKDYNIPFEHIVYTIEKNQYKHNINSLISLIVEKNNNKITNIYFETSEKNLNQQLKEDIIKYLSLFNDIKQY